MVIESESEIRAIAAETFWQQMAIFSMEMQMKCISPEYHQSKLPILPKKKPNILSEADRKVFSYAKAMDVKLSDVADKAGIPFVDMVDLLISGQLTSEDRRRIYIAIDELGLEEGKAI